MNKDSKKTTLKEQVVVRMGDGRVRGYDLSRSKASNVRAAGRIIEKLNSKRTVSRNAVADRTKRIGK